MGRNCNYTYALPYFVDPNHPWPWTRTTSCSQSREGVSVCLCFAVFSFLLSSVRSISSSSSSSSDYMAFYNTASFKKSVLPAATESRLVPLYFSPSSSFRNELRLRVGRMARPMQSSRGWVGVYALDRNKNSSSSSDAKKGVPNSNYVVPLDMSSSCITRPLVEILRDLNKRIPDNIVKPDDCLPIPWYHANRMLSFYAPGWCGEIRDVIFSDNGSVTVVYRVTIRGSDGEAHRESTGTVLPTDGHVDPVAAAEEIAFCRACARFGLGLYLYHGE